MGAVTIKFPEVPVTVTVYVPAVAVLLAVSVRTLSLTSKVTREPNASPGAGMVA